MKKHTRKIVCLLAMVIMIMASATAAFAGSVTYKGQAEKFVFAPGSEYSKTDLFGDQFKGIMPGDSIIDTVTVKNNASDKVNVEIFIRALGATDLQEPEDGIAEVSQEDSQKFLSQMTLTVAQNGNSELFHAPADQTAQLTDWVSLGKFDSGAEVDLNVTLNVPIEMNDDFQNAIGTLDWQFKVVETPIPEETRTGDDMNLLIPIVLIAAAAAGIAALLITRRKKEK